MNEKIIAETKESDEQKRARFIEGRISEEEIKAHWQNPDEPLFEHEIIKDKEGLEQKTRFSIRALSEEFKEPLFDSIKNAWDEVSFNELKATIESFFKQKKLGHPALLNVEYYIATDTKDNPFAISGIYTSDIQDGTGFATREKLDPVQHNMVARMGWFSVDKEYQGTGVGGFLLNWIEGMAKSRGAAMMAVETSDYEGEAIARQMYEKRGYQSGLNVKDYFGPGRDLHNYFYNTYGEKIEKFEPQEIFSPDKKQEILDFAKKHYAPERCDEFEATLDLLFQQKEGEEQILAQDNFILRDKKGDVESFAIVFTGVYDNLMVCPWAAAASENKGKLTEALKSLAQSNETYMLVISQDKKDDELLEKGFNLATKSIPGAYDKDDPNEFLFYTKKM